MESKQVRLEKLRKWREEKKFKERPPFKPAGSIKLGKYEVLQPPPIKLNSRRKNCSSCVYKVSNRERKILPLHAKKNKDLEANKCQNNGLTQKDLSDKRDSFAPDNYKFKGIEAITQYNLCKVISQDKVQADVRSHPIKIVHSLKENATFNTRNKSLLKYQTNLQNTSLPSKDQNKTMSSKTEIEYKRNDIENGKNKSLIQTYSNKSKQKKNLHAHRQISPKPDINNLTVTLSDCKLNSSVKDSSPNECSFITMRFKASPCSSGVNSKTFCTKRMSNDRKSKFSPLNHLNFSEKKILNKDNFPKNINVGECSSGYALVNVTNDMLLHNSSTRRSGSKRNESLDKSLHLKENTTKIKQALFSEENFESPTLDLSDETFATCLMSQPDTPSFVSFTDTTFTKDPEVPSTELWRNSSNSVTDFDDKENMMEERISRILKPLMSEDY